LGGFIAPKGMKPKLSTLSFIHKSENGEYLKSIAYGANGNRLEAYPTLRRRVAAVMVLLNELDYRSTLRRAM
jgi:hypothetical protein